MLENGRTNQVTGLEAVEFICAKEGIQDVRFSSYYEAYKRLAATKDSNEIPLSDILDEELKIIIKEQRDAQKDWRIQIQDTVKRNEESKNANGYISLFELFEYLLSSERKEILI